MESQERPSVDRIAELQELMYEFSRTQRVVQIPGTNRLENDTEHSYALAITAWFLAERIAPHLDRDKIIRYALVHDLVEVYAKDTNAFGAAEHIATKAEREHAALKRLREEWQDFPEMIQTMEDYKNQTDNAAKFVYSVDKILPGFIVNLGEGAEFWKRHKVTREVFKAEKAPKVAVSEEFADYYDEFMEWMSNPDLFAPEE